MTMPYATGAREAETAKQQRDELCVNTIRTLSMNAVSSSVESFEGTRT